MKSFDFDHMMQIPPALRLSFLQELTKKASDPTDPLRLDSLLSLAYCKSLGFTVGDDVSRDFTLEAARLGSITGKLVTLFWSVMNRTAPPIDNREESEWMLDILLGGMLSKNDFKKRVLDAFP